MERYLEAAFRYKWLWLVIVLLMPVTATSYAMRTTIPLYETGATVWTEKPAYLNAIADWNQYQTPAENQAGNVNEMLQSRKFDLEVLGQTDIGKHIATEADVQQAIATLLKYTSVYAVGTHLVAIKYQDPRPAVSVQVVNAIISAFDNELLTNTNAQGAVAVGFYQKQLDDASAKLQQSQAALSDYLTAHPDLVKIANDVASAGQFNDPVFTLQHPDLAKLIQQRDSDAKTQQSLQDELSQITFSQNSAAVVEEQTFRVIDKPVTPIRPMSIRKRLIMPVALSIGGALGFVIGGVILLTLLDTTLRNERLAAARYQLPVVISAIPFIEEGKSGRDSVRQLLGMQARLPRGSEPSL